VLAVWWLACLIWSVGWLFLKVGLHDLPPLTFAALRLGLALVVLSTIVTVRREWSTVRAADVPIIAVSGLLLLGINYALTFWGAQFLPSGITSVLQATSPIFGFVIGTTIGVERFTVARALALPLGVAGVALVSRGPFDASGLAARGSVAVVLGALCAAAAYAIVKRSGTHLPPAVMSATQTAFAFVPLMVGAVVLDGNPLAINWTPPAVAALLYLGIASSVGAFWLNYWLLQRIDTTTVLSMALVQPLVAAALGAVVLGERFGPYAAIGGVCILISAGVILRRRD
jgi:drug/metabolite transporter (DMT)-like permease